jgi:hypothetical protein
MLEFYADKLSQAGAVRSDDTDIMRSAYLGILLTDTLFGTDYASRPAVGGWSHDPAKGEYETLANAFHADITRWSASGILDESTEYNLTSTPIFLAAYDALCHSLGRDPFPYVAEWRKQARIVAGMSISEDGLWMDEWGDAEHPASMQLYYLHPFLASLGANDLVAKLYAIHGEGSLKMPSPGYFYSCDPYDTSTTAKPSSVFASGTGIAYAKCGNALFAAQFSPLPNADHSRPEIQGDFALYDGGELIGAPDLYQQSADCFNMMTFRGIAQFAERFPTETFEGDGWFAIRGGTFGKPYPYEWSPAEFARNRRTIVYLHEPQTVIVRDQFTVTDPVKSKVPFRAYHNWSQPIVSVPAADQVIVGGPHASNWNQVYYVTFADGQERKVLKADADPAGVRITFDAAGVKAKAGDLIAIRGGYEYSLIREAKHLASWTLQCPPGAKLTDRGVRYTAAGRMVDVTHYGDGKPVLDAVTDVLGHNEQLRFPHRYRTTTDSEGSHDWYHVLRFGHVEPVKVSGDSVTVGGKTVTFAAEGTNVQ